MKEHKTVQDVVSHLRDDDDSHDDVDELEEGMAPVGPGDSTQSAITYADDEGLTKRPPPPSYEDSVRDVHGGETGDRCSRGRSDVDDERIEALREDLQPLRKQVGALHELVENFFTRDFRSFLEAQHERLNVGRALGTLLRDHQEIPIVRALVEELAEENHRLRTMVDEGNVTIGRLRARVTSPVPQSYRVDRDTSVVQIEDPSKSELSR